MENKKEFIKEKIGLALLRLKEVEEGLENVVKEAKDNDKEIEEMVKTI